jgi:hypothetical protein
VPSFSCIDVAIGVVAITAPIGASAPRNGV